MNKYEIMYILKANLEESARQAVVEGLHGIITAGNGTIDNVYEWGIKEFAYEINGDTKGYYMVATVSCDTAAIKEFDRLSLINNNVVRHMIVKLEA